MSPSELGWRLRGQVYSAWESRRAGHERYRPLTRPAAAELRTSLRRSLAALVPDAALRDTLPLHFSEFHAHLGSQSQQALRGRVTLFACDYDLGSPIDWHRDPGSGIRAPQKSASALDYRDREQVGSARRIWELNRHHHLVELAQWAWLNHDRPAGAHVVSQLVDWCRENPPLIGINWASSLELAIRTLAWAQIFALLLDDEDPALDDDTLSLLTAAWVRQVVYVREHDSRYSSANNHRIGEVAAVAAAGLLLDFHPRAQSWWQWGKKALEEEVLLQISPDGVGYEQAFAYQRFVVDLLLTIRVLARKQDKDLSGEAIERVAQACHFLDTVTRTDGTVFAVGDDDEGQAFALGERYEDRAEATLECAGWLYDKPAWRRKSFARARWLGIAPLGPVPVEATAPPQLGVRCRSYPSGGYAVVDGAVHDVPMRLLFDAGPLGYGALAAHGHADALSLCLWMGEDLLIDPGTGSYHGNPGWREALRGTDAHNTCQLDELDQSDRRGLFLWGNRAKARFLASGARHPWFVMAGAHDGYHRAGVPETRRIVAGHVSGDCVVLLVVDELIGSGRHRLRVPWHLGPGRGSLVEAGAAPQVAITYPGGARLDARAVVLGGVGEPFCDVVEGSQVDAEAYYSPRFEERQPEGQIRFDVKVDLPASVIWLLRARPGGAADGAGPVALASFVMTPCQGGVSCVVQPEDGGALRALIAHPQSDRVSDGRTRVTGRMALWLEGGRSSETSAAVVAGATEFRCGMMTWKSTDAPVTGVLSALAPRAESFSPGENGEEVDS